MQMAYEYERGEFSFNGTRVYNVLHVKDKAPSFFVGCSTTILRVVEKRKIPQDKYFFVSHSAKNGYKTCSADYKGRKLLINAEWVDSNVPGFGKVESPKVAKIIKKEYPPAPPVLELEDSEKFVDEKGNVIDIEVRGERHFDKIWFKARDVEKMLSLEDICKNIHGTGSAYDEGIHFVTFTLKPLPVTTDKDGIKVNKNELSLFLSYWGLVKMLFGRRHPIAIHFQKWAIGKLFTLQHGTVDSKQELAADVLGVTPKVLKTFLDTGMTCFPTIYLFELGTVKDLRESFKISDKWSDDNVVFKFGMANDLKRRTQEHQKTYGKMKGVEMKLKYHAYVDVPYLKDAENDIRDFFKSLELILDHPSYREIAVLEPRFIKSLLPNTFSEMAKKYAGKLKELQDTLKATQSIIDNITKDLMKEEQHSKEMKEQYEARLRAVEEINAALKELTGFKRSS